jgi:hypothetical protein
MMQEVHVKLNPGLPPQNSIHLENLFISKLDLNSTRKLADSATFGVQLGMMLKLGHFGKSIKNTWKVMEYGFAGGWGR